MALYPNILFHFTSKASFHAILESSFKVSFARERLNGGSKKLAFAVPMVSFSDLRLSELKDNIGTYGKFGIGLTKDWAISKGLNPVMYANQNSPFTENLIQSLFSFSELVNLYEDSTGKYEVAYHNAINTLRYMKNYRGDLIRPKKITINNYVFANEREWRYVPPIQDDNLSFIPIDKIETPGQKANYNQKVKHLRLDFKPDDIKYLIVERDDDIITLIKHLRDPKNEYSKETVDILASRILTYEQIENDV